MVYIAVIGLAVGVVVAVAALVMITTKDDPTGLGRTNQQAFTKGLDSASLDEATEGFVSKLSAS